MEKKENNVSNWKEAIKSSKHEPDAKRYVIYQYLEENQPVSSYDEIADNTGVNKSAVRRAINTLHSLSMVEKVDKEGNEVDKSSRTGKWVLADYSSLEQEIFESIKDLVNAGFIDYSVLNSELQIDLELKKKIRRLVALKVNKNEEDDDFLEIFGGCWTKFEQECEVDIIEGKPVIFQKSP